MSSAIELVNDLQRLVTSIDSGHDAKNQFDLYKAKHIMVNQCMALLRTLLGSKEYTAILAASCQESAALHLVTSLGIADMIAASPRGQMSVTELCAVTRTDKKFLEIALSCLNYHGYFIRTIDQGSEFYANNEFSELLRSNGGSHGENSMVDSIGFATDEGAKAASRIVDAAQSVNPDESAAKLALGFSGSIFDWMASPGNQWRGQRLGKAMVQLHQMANTGTGEDYPWENLATPIIDIGGGLGSFEVMLFAFPKNKDLSFKLFDIPDTIENAKKAWNAKPQWMQDRITFIPGDFLKSDPQESKIPLPSEGAGTYVIRHVLFDWEDYQVVNILKNVRTAMLASASTVIPKLVIVEMLLREDSTRFAHSASLQVLALGGGYTRTEGDMRKLIEQAGFVVENILEVRGVDYILEVKPSV